MFTFESLPPLDRTLDDAEISGELTGVARDTTAEGEPTGVTLVQDVTVVRSTLDDFHFDSEESPFSG